jgi:hypothetical protein
MRRIPDARDVARALRAARSAVARSFKSVNTLAAQRMAKGDYEFAEALATKGRAVREFLGQVDALIQRWKEVAETGESSGKVESTPLWAYYQPILRALTDAGGEATRIDLEPRVLRLMSSVLLPADSAEMTRGRKRWQLMLRRARKALVAEGWLEAGAGKAWRITTAGRVAAENRTIANSRED